MGAGFSREKISNELPVLTFYSGIASVRVWIFEFEYNYLKTGSDIELSPIHIVTASASVNRLILTAAIRRLNYWNSGMVNQTHYAVQALVTDRLSLGVLYNYIPGATSLGVQFYF